MTAVCLLFGAIYRKYLLNRMEYCLVKRCAIYCSTLRQTSLTPPESPNRPAEFPSRCNTALSYSRLFRVMREGKLGDVIFFWTTMLCQHPRFIGASMLQTRLLHHTQTPRWWLQLQDCGLHLLYGTDSQTT